MKEVWKDIYFIENSIEYDYRGIYQVSNQGKIKSLNYKRTGKEKILKNVKDNKGYLIINLYKNKKRKLFKVHRIVGHMFVSGYFDGAEIDHINAIRNDNRFENLKWVTSKENSNNEFTIESYKKANENRYYSDKTKQKISNALKGEKNPNAKKVAQYDLDGNLIKVWNYAKEITETFGWNYGTFRGHLDGRYSHKYKGFIWKYKNFEIEE